MQQQAGQANYMLNGAETRKAKANELFKERKYQEAIDMYAAIVKDISDIQQSSRSATLIKVRVSPLCAAMGYCFPLCWLSFPIAVIDTDVSDTSTRVEEVNTTSACSHSPMHCTMLCVAGMSIEYRKV